MPRITGDYRGQGGFKPAEPEPRKIEGSGWGKKFEVAINSFSKEVKELVQRIKYALMGTNKEEFKGFIRNTASTDLRELADKFKLKHTAVLKHKLALVKQHLDDIKDIKESMNQELGPHERKLLIHWARKLQETTQTLENVAPDVRDKIIEELSLIQDILKETEVRHKLSGFKENVAKMRSEERLPTIVELQAVTKKEKFMKPKKKDLEEGPAKKEDSAPKSTSGFRRPETRQKVSKREFEESRNMLKTKFEEAETQGKQRAVDAEKARQAQKTREADLQVTPVKGKKKSPTTSETSKNVEYYRPLGDPARLFSEPKPAKEGEILKQAWKAKEEHRLTPKEFQSKRDELAGAMETDKFKENRDKIQKERSMPKDEDFSSKKAGQARILQDGEMGELLVQFARELDQIVGDVEEDQAAKPAKKVVEGKAAVKAGKVETPKKQDHKEIETLNLINETLDLIEAAYAYSGEYGNEVNYLRDHLGEWTKGFSSENRAIANIKTRLEKGGVTLSQLKVNVETVTKILLHGFEGVAEYSAKGYPIIKRIFRLKRKAQWGE